MYTNDMVITGHVKVNPKAPGSYAAWLFGLYGVAANGGATCTVAQYLAVCKAQEVNNKEMHKILTWDVAHGYISIA